MGLLRRFIPWYNWDAQWSFHVEHLPDLHGGSNSQFVCPHGYRFQILTVAGHVHGSAFGAGFVIRVRLSRGELNYCLVRPTFSFTATSDDDWCIGPNQARITRDTALFTLGDGMPSDMMLLPGDVLTVETNSTTPQDEIGHLCFSAKRWDD